MNRFGRDAAIVCAIAAFVFFIGLGGPRLWDRDEPRNAGCAAEMLTNGDWITPVFNAELRSHKPVLTYWFMMVSYALLGVNEFSARLPSAIFGIGTTLLTWWMGTRLFGRNAGLWAGIALATSIMFGVASRAATPDAPLIFFTTLALAVFVYATTRQSTDLAGSDADSKPGFVRMFPERWELTALMYGVMAMAVLAKGPIGLILPTAAIGMFLLIEWLPARKPVANEHWTEKLVALVRPFHPIHFLKTCWKMRLFTAVAMTLLIAGPWYLWVSLRTDGAWTYGFFVNHNVGRALNSMDGHNGGILFYPAAIIAGFFPWSIFWLPFVIDAVRQARKGSAAYVFALCYVGVYLGLFTLAKTKLPSYITPCYPGLALLCGAFIDRWLNGALRMTALWRRLSFGSLILVGIGIAVALPVLSTYFLPGEAALGAVGLVLVAGGTAALLLSERKQNLAALQLTAGTATVFLAALFAIVSVRVDRHRHLEDLVQAVYDGETTDEVQLASLSSTEASWVFYCRQPIPELLEPQDALSFLETPDDSDKRRVLITTTRRLPRLQEVTDLAGFSMQTVPYFLEDEEIVVVTRSPDAMASADSAATPVLSPVIDSGITPVAAEEFLILR